MKALLLQKVKKKTSSISKLFVVAVMIEVLSPCHGCGYLTQNKFCGDCRIYYGLPQEVVNDKADMSCSENEETDSMSEDDSDSSMDCSSDSSDSFMVDKEDDHGSKSYSPQSSCTSESINSSEQTETSSEEYYIK